MSLLDLHDSYTTSRSRSASGPVVATRSGAEQNHLFDTVDLRDGLCDTAGMFVMVDDGGNDRKDVHVSMVAPRTEVSWCVRADWVQVHLNPYAFGRPVGRVTLQSGVESTSCVIGLPSDSQDPDLHQQLERLPSGPAVPVAGSNRVYGGLGSGHGGFHTHDSPGDSSVLHGAALLHPSIAVSGIKG